MSVRPSNLIFEIIFFIMFAVVVAGNGQEGTTSTTVVTRADNGSRRFRVLPTNTTASTNNYGRETEITNLTDELAEASLGNSVASSRADHGRGLMMGDGFSSIITRFSKVLDLGRVVREIETSVMTSVSCTACRAGGSLLFFVSFCC